MGEEIVTANMQPRESLVTTAHVVYGLHTLSVLMGASSLATIVLVFVFGLPSIVAVIINYATQSDAKGTFLESHFRWQIRTFWFSALWVIAALAMFISIIGIPFAYAIVIGVGVWVIYRIARGWLALSRRAPLNVEF